MIDSYNAYLFDLDGVITPTVELHRRAWAETFDAFFASRGLPPYHEEEYFASLDGRNRFEGVRALLAARGVALPEGVPGETGLDSVIGIGNRKNAAFTEVLERDGIAPYPGSLRLLDRLASQGARLAVVSSSRNAEAVLRAAGLRERFLAVVDGVVAEREGLAGKPAPDTFVRAAALLGAAPSEAVVFEDAASGVAAARAGGFGLVVGVDRGAGPAALLAAGADRAVPDLAELLEEDA
ncbi:beta-phosphoglucomutase family hydrolase [Leucobacter massiliensis]|uniref:Beta-phosphoglucomutase n=1 Tax=Leucobacter massiliensis TaxID=1686285 RepID=A0A2S9QMI9_9MICO|nr:beta-phosphoglucomutase family hydrolase [Leucobacter massiliensis]PRI10814.1 haloacid dehalogenase [Leucobacter massiliensis]